MDHGIIQLNSYTLKQKEKLQCYKDIKELSNLLLLTKLEQYWLVGHGILQLNSGTLKQKEKL